MAVSILFSAFLALTLTPALCATLLTPVADGHHEKRGFFGGFNRRFEQLTQHYAAGTRALLRRSGSMLLLFAALTGSLAWIFSELPSDFLPQEDQGYFMTSIQLPSDATEARTLDVVKTYEQHVASRPGIASNMSILGFGFSGSGPNAAMAFTTLKDWSARDGATAQGEVTQAQQAMSSIREGTAMTLMPPAIDELGTSSGFTLRLQDRAGQGYTALKAAETKLLTLAAQSHIVAGVYPDGLPPGSTVRLNIDRQKAEALGVSFSTLSETLSAAIGSLYVNDFPNAGRMQQVIIQADAPARMQLDDVLRLYVRNTAGGMVSLKEVVTPVWSDTPLQLTRYQGFLAARISGSAVPGVSSGAAMAEMERLAAQLPPGFTVAWTGQSLQERQSAAQAPMLLLLSMVVVFLVLAALYESWSIPLSVMLVVPLGLLGAVLAVILRDMPNDVFFKVGLITVIGLSAKNAILIVEFARQLREQGHELVDAAVTAARLRLRPILMTSLAFALGVVPLMVASGASAETQHAIGTGVFGGMVSATVLAVFFVPVFFVAVMSVQERYDRWRDARRAMKTPTAPDER
ncbi:putative efflux pump membrane transporter TtgB [Dickeya solani]|nr:putative efflux pump membrane transporter TtgB [Dickeya solani]